MNLSSFVYVFVLCFVFYFYVVARVYALDCVYSIVSISPRLWHRWMDIYISMVDGHFHKFWLLHYMVYSVYIYTFINNNNNDNNEATNIPNYEVLRTEKIPYIDSPPCIMALAQPRPSRCSTLPLTTRWELRTSDDKRTSLSLSPSVFPFFSLLSLPLVIIISPPI